MTKKGSEKMTFREKSILSLQKITHAWWFMYLMTAAVLFLFIKIVIFSAGGSIINAIAYIGGILLFITIIIKTRKYLLLFGIIGFFIWFIYYA